MAIIFISYSKQDQATATDLAKQLQVTGHKVRYDEVLLHPGTDFVQVLNTAMQEADGFIFLLTENSISSSYVMKEYGNAEQMQKEGKFLIPIVSGSIKLPSFLNGLFHLRLEDTQLIHKINEAIYTVAPEKAIHATSSTVPPDNARDSISIAPDEKQGQKEVDTPKKARKTSKKKPSYWFLKLNPGTWNFEDFPRYHKDGEECFFATHNLANEQRIDYDTFFKVKKGDRAIGYAFGEKRTVECVFEITKEVHFRKEAGESIALKIVSVVAPPIPIEYFAQQLPFRDKLEAADPERLFQVSEEVFNTIIASDYSDFTGREGYLQNYTTEGNHRATDDQLSFTADIASFSTVICLKKVNPPLAIGLFGKWGSGKSFFMEKMTDYIDQIAMSDDPRYVQHVVQVKFNSWHYSDANLWASLITELFDALHKYAGKLGKGGEIEKLSATLQLTSLHREAAELKRRQLTDEVFHLKEVQRQKRERLEDLSGLKFLRMFISDPGIKKDLESLNNSGLQAIRENKDTIEGYIVELKGFYNSLKGFYYQLKSLRGIRWRWLIATAIIVFIGTALIQTGFSLEWEQITFWFSVKTAVIAAAAGKIIEAIKSYDKIFEQINSRWKSLKKTFDGRPLEAPSTDPQEKELFQVTNEIKAIEQKIDFTKREISDISSGKKLLEFIDQKSRDQGYASQLGLIALIRKDFQILDSLLREQHAAGNGTNNIDNPEGVQIQIDRIVLYIDDLDRCNEEIVVRVLEAVHLLLAFPLFVVVVGVDPRWLNNALNKKYSNLFQSEAGNHRHSITSYDYLEKIFQIPFTLREADKNDRQRLLKYLMREEVAEQHPPKQEVTPKDPDRFAKENVPAPMDPVIVPDVELSAFSQNKDLINKVDFLEEEIDYMESISGMFGATPRMMNRYVNIYRILKSHKSYQVATIPSARDYKPTMFMLGVIIGCPHHARDFVELLLVTKKDSMVDFIDQLENEPLRNFIIRHTDKNAVADLTTTMARKNAALISRFSFRTYESTPPVI